MKDCLLFLCFFHPPHKSHGDLYRGTCRWHETWLQVKSRDYLHQNSKMHCILKWFKTGSQYWSYYESKPRVIIVLLEIQLSTVLVVQTNPPAMRWIFPFNICVMFSRPFTGSFYLSKCTIIYLTLCKSCMSYDSFHLDSYYSLIFWFPILCSPVWWWKFSP